MGTLDYVILVIGIAAGAGAMYLFFNSRRHDQPVLFVLLMFVMTVVATIFATRGSEARLGEKLFDPRGEVIPVEETPYYALTERACLYSEPNAFSECRLEMEPGTYLYAYTIKDETWIRARTLVFPGEALVPEEIGWVHKRHAAAANFPSRMMVLSMMRQVFSLNDAYLMLVEVGLGAATVQLFRRKHRVARFIVGIPFLLLTLLHGLELLAEILSYNIRDVGFMSLMPYYPLPIVFGIFATNSLVDFLIHRISSKEVSETPPWKKRVRGFVLGTLLLLLFFVGLTWVARQMLGPSILFRPYPRPEVPLQLIDSRSPVASMFFLASLALIGLLAWMQGSRLQEQGLDTLKRIGFYLVISCMFHYMLMMLVTSYTELDDIQAGSLISAYWFSGALLWFLLGWDVIFVYLPFSPQLRTPAPLFGQGQTCLYCQQKVRFEKGRIRGHDPRCLLLPDPAADGLMRRCMELMEQKKWDTAANMLRAATEAHPHYLKFFTYYGKALLELGKVDQALEVLSMSAGVDWTSNHDAILTEARIAKAKLDAGYREQLLAEAQAAVKVKGPPNFLAQRIIKELENPQKAVEGKNG